MDLKASLFGGRTSWVHVPFIEKECCGRDRAVAIQSSVRFYPQGAGRRRELLTPSGWWLMAGAGLVDGSASRLAQLSSRREETIYTGCQGNAERGKALKYGNIKAIRS